MRTRCSLSHMSMCRAVRRHDIRCTRHVLADCTEFRNAIHQLYPARISRTQHGCHVHVPHAAAAREPGAEAVLCSCATRTVSARESPCWPAARTSHWLRKIHWLSKGGLAKTELFSGAVDSPNSWRYEPHKIVEALFAGTVGAG